MEMFEPYAFGVISFLVFVLIVLVQSALVGAGKAKAGLTPGSEPDPDYDSALYRLNRSHQNGVEIMPAAAVVLLVSVAVGVSSWWFNLLMGIFLLTRILYVVVYSQKLGNPNQSLRTGVFVAGWATVVILCIMAILKLL